MGIEAILLIFALAFVGITRGSYKNLFAIKMNHWWALVPVLIGHLAIEFVPIKQNQFDSVGISILLTTYVFLFGFLWANLNLKAMWIALLGASSNALVIALNLGMPVTNSGGYSAVETIKHQPATSSDLLSFLGDIIPLNFASIAISVGDIIFAAGLISVCYFASRRTVEKMDSEGSDGKIQIEQIIDLTEGEEPLPVPTLQSSKGPVAKRPNEQRAEKLEKMAQSRKHKRWQKKHGYASLPSKEELGFDDQSMEIVDIAK